jgi:3-deoxy-manno-octulosonate cytidylyltransferase (CMP-KDO synthetase)
VAILVIPARYASKRLPGKPLLSVTGKPLVVHVLERAAEAERISRVLVATDDERILAAVKEAGGEAVLTSRRHTCGTERVAEVAGRFPEERFFVNLQGDEPEIEPGDIDLLVRALEEGGCEMATLAAPLTGEEDHNDPSVVKVVVGRTGDALYFSRAPIPFARDEGSAADRLRHLGIYGYTMEALRRFVELPPSTLEKTEKLEQLRALEHGMRIRVALVREAPPGIDTMEAYRAFVMRTASAGSGGNAKGGG